MASLREEYLKLRCRQLEREVHQDRYRDALDGWFDYWQTNAEFEDQKTRRGEIRRTVMRQVAHALTNSARAGILIACERLKWALDSSENELRDWRVIDPDDDDPSLDQTPKRYEMKALF